MTDVIEQFDKAVREKYGLDKKWILREGVHNPNAEKAPVEITYVHPEGAKITGVLTHQEMCKINTVEVGSRVGVESTMLPPVCIGRVASVNYSAQTARITVMCDVVLPLSKLKCEV